MSRSRLRGASAGLGDRATMVTRAQALKVFVENGIALLLCSALLVILVVLMVRVSDYVRSDGLRHSLLGLLLVLFATAVFVCTAFAILTVGWFFRWRAPG